MKRLGLWVLCIGLVMGMAGTVTAQNSGMRLIHNGDFEQNLDFWTLSQPCTSCAAWVEGDEAAGSDVLIWQRTNSGASGSAIGVVQSIDQDVSGAQALTLTARVRVDMQELPNSGWWSDQHAGSGEYPAKITLNFTDAAGVPFEWAMGFLFIHDGSTVLMNHVTVEQGEWTPFEVNVLAEGRWVDGFGHPLPAPARLVSIMVGGSGWDFAGAMDDVQLISSQGSSGGAGESGGHTLSGFIVEEYPLVAASEDRPDHFEFRDRVTAQILDVRRAWREPELDVALIAANRAIASAGYMLIPNYDDNHTYTLVHQDSILFADVVHLFPVAVSESGDDFRLLFESMSAPGVLVMTPETIGYVDSEHFVYIAPVYVGEDLIDLWADWGQNQFQVRRNDQVIYTVVPQQPFVEPPVKALWSWNGQWVLESEGHVIIDGVDMNASMGASEMFGWRILNGQPFYFFRPVPMVEGGERIIMSYAGQNVVPYLYDEVVHYQCCEPSMFNVSGNDTMVWFYALRDGMWYYVEAGVYE